MLFLRKTPLFITSITRTIVTKPYYKKHLGASYSLARPQDDTKNSSRGRKYLNCLFYVASGYLTYKLFKKESLIPSVEAAVKSEDPTKRFNFIADVVEIAAPAVVYIEIKDTRRRDFFTGKPITISNGSGFIIQENGLILTNAHVVTNKPDSAVEVRLLDGKTYKGVVEDVDQQSDLATVRISASKLPIIKLGDSSVLRPGEFVVAIGSPLALSNTVTFGVVSSTNRGSDELGLQGRHMDFIQTDAAITFGNSGGPLVNLNGEAIGINSMKVTAGISFAIPSNYVKEFLKYAEGVKKTKGGALKRKYLGITMLTLSPQILSELRQRNEHIPPNVKNGVLVWKVIWGSPAFNGGLQPGDIVTHIDGKEVTSANDIYGLLNKGGSGTLNLIVVRNGRQIELQVTPESID